MTYTLTRNNYVAYNYSYDPKFDILKASFPNNGPFYYEEAEDEILLMLNDLDDSIVGFQILDYSSINKDIAKKILPSNLSCIFSEIEKEINK